MPSRTKAEAALKPRKVRHLNLRRAKKTKVTNLEPSDVVIAAFDDSGWRLTVESANGVQIEHIRLTGMEPQA